MSLFNSPVSMHLEAIGFVFIMFFISLIILFIMNTIVQVYDNKRRIKELEEKE